MVLLMTSQSIIVQVKKNIYLILILFIIDLLLVSLDTGNGSCITLVDPSAGICVPNKTENVHLNVSNMMTRINE